MESLIRFLRISPLDEISSFRKHVSEPLKFGDAQGLQNLHLLLDSICLRRTRTILKLPNIVHETRELDFSPAEWAKYNSVVDESKRMIDDAVRSKVTVKAYQTVLLAILQLRLICNHGTFERNPEGRSRVQTPRDLGDALRSAQQVNESACAYCKCRVDPADGLLAECFHLTCISCFQRYEAPETDSHPNSELPCPLCRQQLESNCDETDDEDPTSESSNVYSPAPVSCFGLGGQSTKVSALLEDIENSTSDKW